jgi:aconitate hydratase
LNLIGMGVLPLQFKDGEGPEALGLDGTETFDIHIDNALQAGQDVPVVATKPDGSTVEFAAVNRCDTPIEVEYYRHGGILHYVLRDFLNRSMAMA